MVKYSMGRSWTLDATQNWVDTTCGIDTVDPNWRGTDTQGHEHHYDRGYPTLDYVIDAEHWCDGTEGIYNHDPHMAVDESHYECKLCREVVTPGVIPAGTPSQIPGSIDATLSGVRSDGATVTMWVTKEAVEMLRTVGNPDVLAQSMLDRAEESTPERLISIERGG